MLSSSVALPCSRSLSSMRASAAPALCGAPLPLATRRRRAASALSASASVDAPAAPKIRIKLRSFEHVNLREAGVKIVEAATRTGAAVAGPTPLPTRRRVYCVLRSPHVNKNSMEHFQMLTHQRLIDVKNPTAQTIDALMQLDMPAGVDIVIKI